MTVGIGAACEGEDEDYVVVAADRMITSGRLTRIEYEHTKTKLTTVVDDPEAAIDGVHCIALSAGTVSYADTFFTKLDDRLAESDLAGVQHIATIGADIIQEMARERGNRQVLNQFGISLEDIRDGNVNMSDAIVQQLLKEVSEEKHEILDHLDLLFAGVDHTGANIYSIPDGNVSPHNRIGYHAIGSGAQPARSSFIRSRYDTDCDIEEALLNVYESKVQSEEAQGVGAKMDMSVISTSQGCYHLTSEAEIEEESDETSELGELANLYDNIVDSESEVRAETLSNSEYEFLTDHED